MCNIPHFLLGVHLPILEYKSPSIGLETARYILYIYEYICINEYYRKIILTQDRSLLDIYVLTIKGRKYIQQNLLSFFKTVCYLNMNY